MKKALLLLAAVAMASSSYAQGTLTFFNRLIPNPGGAPGTYTAGIFRDNGDGISGNGTVGAGDGFTAGLFLSSDLSTPIATATFRPSSGTLSEAFAATQTVTFDGTGGKPNLAPGTTHSFTIRAWETAAGSYAASLHRGEGTFTSQQLGGTPTGGGAPIPTPGLTGFTGFEMQIVPEPSTIALGLLGLGAVAMMRRRK
jgi:hypothetical protein